VVGRRVELSWVLMREIFITIWGGKKSTGGGSFLRLNGESFFGKKTGTLGKGGVGFQGGGGGGSKRGGAGGFFSALFLFMGGKNSFGGGGCFWG